MILTPCAARADYNFSSDGTGVTITGGTGSPATTWVLPSSFEGLPVTAVGAGAFQNCTSLSNIVIPCHVTNIAAGAFSGCTSLAGVYCRGDAPVASDQAFEGAAGSRVYRLPGASGWDAALGGRPVSFWVLPLTLADGDFAGTLGTAPGAAFSSYGTVFLNGTGQLFLDTKYETPFSWVKSVVGAAPAAGQELVLRMRLSAYAEGTSPGVVYGDKQPRGLRVGGDAANAVEFYSETRTTLGMRVCSNGVTTSLTCALPSGVNTMHDYEIVVAATSVCFLVDGAVAGTVTNNIPSGELSAYLDTYYTGGGEVPIYLDSISFQLRPQVTDVPILSGMSPTTGAPSSSVMLDGYLLGTATAVLFGGVPAAFTVLSDSQIVATVPAAAQSGPVTVVTAGGSTVSSGSFTVAVPIVELVQNDFAGGSGASPDSLFFTWAGEVAQNGAGWLVLNTKFVSQSWLATKAAGVATANQRLVLQMRLSAYAEGTSPGAVYGDKQPRGLRVGTNANNVLEFYSATRTTLGMRARRNGVETLVTAALPSGVNTMHDYEIGVTTTAAFFKVDGVLLATITNNLPVGALNAFVDTSDGGFGEVPAWVDRLSLSLRSEQPVAAPVVAGAAPAIAIPGTNVVLNGVNFTTVSSVRFGVQAAAFTVLSDTQIVATVPPTAFTAPIRVSGPGGEGAGATAFVVDGGTVVLLDETFAGGAGAPPDAALFEWCGEVTQNGAGQLRLGTVNVGHSWLRGRCGTQARQGQTVTLRMRASAYVDAARPPGVYGDGQPRGLRVGGDASQAVEFFSQRYDCFAMHLRNGASETIEYRYLTTDLDAQHDYVINMSSTGVVFGIDGMTIDRLFTNNLPAGVLSPYVSTDDGGFDDVPVLIDSLSLTRSGSRLQDPPVLAGFAPAVGGAGMPVTLSGTNLGSILSVSFAGVPAAFTALSDTQLVATVPASVETGLLVVAGPNGAATSGVPFVVSAMVTTASEAALTAALASGNPLVTFACDGVVTQTTPRVIASDVCLDAAGHSVVLSGRFAGRVLEVNPGVHLTLRNLTVADGVGAIVGGGVNNNGGTLTAVNCTFRNNTVIQSPVSAGVAWGGAIYNQNGGSLFLTNCTFSGNTAVAAAGNPGVNGTPESKDGGAGGTGGVADGGAIFTLGAYAELVNCTLGGNASRGGQGGQGGMGADGYSYQLKDAWGSWHTYYVAGGVGGRGGDGGGASGGAIYCGSGTTRLVNVTMARNLTVPGVGGGAGWPGAYCGSDNGPGTAGLALGANSCVGSGILVLKNTLLACGDDGGAACSGAIGDAGNNLCADGTASFTAATSWNSTPPMLATNLAANGGSTLTFALANESPAINGGSADGAPATDQRGMPRNGHPDIGAYESQETGSCLPYAWLTKHGFPTDGLRDHDDSDHDGIDNAAEWVCATDPTNGQSVLRITFLQSLSGDNCLFWQSVAGKHYTIECSTRLDADAEFVPVQDVVGEDGLTTFFHAAGTSAGTLFYRVRVAP